MQQLFSIGEMAKLHNTSIQTLRYYDEIGLLVPEKVDAGSGYRFYSTEQFEQLNTIQYLKDLGFSLKEIKAHLEHRDIEHFMQLLQSGQDSTEAKIRELQRTSRKYQQRMQEIRRAQALGDHDLETVLFQDLGPRTILRLEESIISEHSLEIALRKLENRSARRPSLMIGGVGLTISMENLLNHQFHEYNSVFILAEDADIQDGLARTFPGGKYACIYYRGPRSLAPDYYRIMLAEIRKSGMTPAGDSIERTLIDHYISNNTLDHITEIQIPLN